MSDSPPLLTEVRDAVALLTLNRPETRNALNRELVLALGEALGQVASNENVRAVLLQGSGGSFCSGADLRAAMSEGNVDFEARINEFHALIHGIVSAPKPFVAAIEGPAVGFGADLALACDLRVISSTGYLQEKFVKIGLMPDGGGTFWLPRLVGMGRALEYLMLGTRIDAALCLELGLVNRRVEPERLEATALELATELAAGPPLALAQIRHAVRESFKGDIFDALEREKREQQKLLVSNDAIEGVMAWLQRRAPEFKGR